MFQLVRWGAFPVNAPLCVSYGCIRMYNADILDLYGRVGFGTPVVVTR